jgi:hypothetical protein
MAKGKQALAPSKIITKGEREELRKAILKNAKVARNYAKYHGVRILANVEEKLAAIYKFEDEALIDITAEAKKAVDDADAALAARCRERGIPENFRPSLSLGFYGRGENAIASRRAELRKVAQTRVEAMVMEATLAIDREEAAQLMQLTITGLTSDEAIAFLESMPSPEDLMPSIEALKLPGGEMVALVHVQSECTPTVTVERNGVTGEATDRNACPTCNKALAPGKGRYCSSACRQAAYRKRQRPAVGAEPRGG